MTDWQPIETAPKNGEELLLCDCRIDRKIVACYDDDDHMTDHPWATIDGHYPRWWPTHWMRLPNPPHD